MPFREPSSAPLPTLFTLGLAALGAGCSAERVEIPSANADSRVNAYQLVTGDDADAERERWNQAFRRRTLIYGEEPVPFLKENLRSLPRGKALVLAMEQGRNAVFLARHGFDVTGVDFSDEAIRKAKRLAHKYDVKLHVINADLNTYDIEPETYDLIVAIEFYRPRLFGEIKKGLKRGGVVVWESHTIEQAKSTSDRAARVDNFLKPGELRQAFSGYQILLSRETNDGKRAVASLIARKQ